MGADRPDAGDLHQPQSGLVLLDQSQDLLIEPIDIGIEISPLSGQRRQGGKQRARYGRLLGLDPAHQSMIPPEPLALISPIS